MPTVKTDRLYPLDRIRNKSAGRTSVNSVRSSAFAKQNISERSEADIYCSSNSKGDQVYGS